MAVDSDGPTALVLSRQSLPVLEGTARPPTVWPGAGYVLADRSGRPDLVLIGTGSEVWVCVAAARLLAEGAAPSPATVPGAPVSPAWCRCRPGISSASRSEAYRAEVLPPGVPRLAVEAAASFGWERYADDVVAIDHFGASAPGDVVLAHFGYTPDNVAARAGAARQSLRRALTA